VETAAGEEEEPCLGPEVEDPLQNCGQLCPNRGDCSSSSSSPNSRCGSSNSISVKPVAAATTIEAAAHTVDVAHLVVPVTVTTALPTAAALEAAAVVAAVAA
jgi:hypothetical protein